MSHSRYGLVTCSGLVIASMIGAGIFTTSGYSLALLGTPQRVLMAWLAGAALAITGAICYGALAARLRESGGEYLFLSRTFHPCPGFVAGWISLWAGFTAPIALAAASLGAYSAGLFGLPESSERIIASIAIVLAMGTQLKATLGARIQNTIVGAKLVALVLIAIAGCWLVFGASEGVAWSSAEPTSIPEFRLSAFGVAVMWISLSYSGWNGAVYIAGEVRDVQRTLPRALLLGTLLTTGIYLALNAFFVYSAPIETLTASENIRAIAATAADAAGGHTAAVIVRMVIIVALLTSVTGNLMAGPRVYARMAEDGVFPEWFRLRGDAPTGGLILQAALSIMLVWWTTLQQLLGYVGFTLAISTAISVVGLIVLRLREGKERVPVPGWPVIPFVFVIATGYFGVLMFMETAEEPLAGVITIASGVVVYLGIAVYRRLRPKPASDQAREAI